MRVFTHYSDGQVGLSNVAPCNIAQSTYIDITLLEWWFWLAYLRFDRRVNRWLNALDNQAYDALDARQDFGRMKGKAQ
jgi:hypothetical protein